MLLVSLLCLLSLVLDGLLGDGDQGARPTAVFICAGAGGAWSYGIWEVMGCVACEEDSRGRVRLADTVCSGVCTQVMDASPCPCAQVGMDPRESSGMAWQGKQINVPESSAPAGFSWQKLLHLFACSMPLPRTAAHECVCSGDQVKSAPSASKHTRVGMGPTTVKVQILFSGYRYIYMEY